MGYVLPWGQMSFLGAPPSSPTCSPAIPYFGESIVTLLWGRLFRRQSDAEPLLLAALSAAVRDSQAVVVLHVWALHVAGQNNPAGVEPKTEKDNRTVHAARQPSRICSAPAASCCSTPGSSSTCRIISATPGQLHRRQSRRNPGPYRARVVLPAVLRDASQHSKQARRRDRDVLVDPDTGILAVARYRENQVVPDIVRWRSSSSGFFCRRRRACWVTSARKPPEGIYVIAGPHPDLLLLRLFPDRCCRC